MRIFQTTLCIVFCFASVLRAQPTVYLKAFTDSTEYFIGDRVDLHIEARTESTVDSIAPMVRDSLGSFEILHVERRGTDLVWTIYMSTIDSGRVFVPPVTFRYYVHQDTTPRFASTNPFFVTFRGIVINPQGDIRDIKPPLSAPLEFADVLPYLIVLLVLGGAIGGWYIYKKRRNRQEVSDTPVITIPPHKEALAALRQLEEKKLWQQGLVKEYYSELTTILRLFFERRWDILALESTTDEILAQMKRIPEALLLWNDLEWCLRTADLVKFAKFIPSPEDNNRALQNAYDIVRAMAPREQEPQHQPQQQPVEVNHVG